MAKPQPGKARIAKSAQGTRERLLQAASRLLASGGPGALTARDLTSALGVSTMALYTHFGGMPELVDALVRDGFVKLGERLGTPARSDDPLVDLFRLGLAYRQYALENHALYHVMFGVSRPVGHNRSVSDLTTTGTPTTLAEAQATFLRVVHAVERLAESHRLSIADPTQFAAQLWSSLHGYVLLELSGYFGEQGHGLEQVLIPLAINLAVGVGETRAAATRAARAAMRPSRASRRSRGGSPQP